MKRRGFRRECHRQYSHYMGHHSTRTDIGMPVYNGGIHAFLVDTDKARGGMTSREGLEEAL